VGAVVCVCGGHVCGSARGARGSKTHGFHHSQNCHLRKPKHFLSPHHNILFTHHHHNYYHYEGACEALTQRSPLVHSITLDFYQRQSKEKRKNFSEPTPSTATGVRIAEGKSKNPLTAHKNKNKSMCKTGSFFDELVLCCTSIIVTALCEGCTPGPPAVMLDG
jgi:hypothetical protein